MDIRLRSRGDEGFTLVEIIIGMAILGILMSAIGSALIVGLRTYVGTGARLSKTHDAQITSAYLANDVQSASTVSVVNATSACASTTELVRFVYAGSGKVATYSCGPSGGETRLFRAFTNGSSTSTSVLSHFVGSVGPVTCTGCGTSSPATVSIRVTETADDADAAPYSYTLVGSQRLSAPGTTTWTGGGTADITLFVLGGGSTPMWVSGSCPKGQIDNPGNPNNTCTADSEVANGQPSTPKLTVKGNLYVNSSTVGAVRLSGKKSDVKLSIENGDFKILAGGTCLGCTPQTVVCPACTSTPPGSYTPALLDPLRFMTAPDETGMPVYSDGNYHGPGVYTTTLSLTGNTSFAPGTYVLNNGMSVTGSAVLSGSGVTFYNKGGGVSFAGTSTFGVSPPPAGEQYAGVVIFQARTNTSAMSLLGSSGNTPVGILYAPNSSLVTLGGGDASLKVTAVIAQGIKVSGSAQVTIG